MISVFAGALRYIGLSQVEAGRHLDVSVQRVKDWSTGRSRVPDGVWTDLAAIARRRDAAIASLGSLTLADAETIAATGNNGTLADDIFASALAGAMLVSASEPA